MDQLNYDQSKYRHLRFFKISRSYMFAHTVSMPILDAWGWCTGMTQRDGMGREEGYSGWGTHVHPWLIHVTVWQKPPQYCKVISLQLK